LDICCESINGFLLIGLKNEELFWTVLLEIVQVTDLNNFHLQWLRFTRWALACFVYRVSLEKSFYRSCIGINKLMLQSITSVLQGYNGSARYLISRFVYLEWFCTFTNGALHVDVSHRHRTLRTDELMSGWYHLERCGDRYVSITWTAVWKKFLSNPIALNLRISRQEERTINVSFN